jgi:hypothetical protein
MGLGEMCHRRKNNLGKELASGFPTFCKVNVQVNLHSLCALGRMRNHFIRGWNCEKHRSCLKVLLTWKRPSARTKHPQDQLIANLVF